jgi:hypothetical protein
MVCRGMIFPVYTTVDEESNGDEPADAAPQEAELVGELMRALPGVVGEIIANDAEIKAAIEKSELDPQDVNSSLMGRADEVLRFTNREIAQLREAKASVKRHETLASVVARLDARVGGGSRRDDALVGVGLWMMSFWPLAIWQAWPPLSTAISGWLGTLVMIAGTITVAWISISCFIVPRARRAGIIDPGLWGAFFFAGLDSIIGYCVLAWRLWNHTEHAFGTGWSDIIWILAGAIAVAGGGFLIIIAIVNTDNNGFGKAISTPSFPLAAAAGLAAWLIGAHYLFSARDRTALGSHASAIFAFAIALIAVIAMPFILGGVRAVVRALATLISRTIELPGQRSWLRRRRNLTREVTEAEIRWRDAAADAIRPLLREEIQLMSVPPFSTTRETVNPRGLQHMRSVDDVIETRAFDRLRTLVDTLSGGAVGMAGPRGAGKSTLLDYYGSGRLAAVGTEQLTLIENVPVRYDARDYALYLYAALCEKVIGFRTGLPGDKTIRAADPRASRRWRPTMVLLFAAWVTIGYLVVISSVGPETDHTWLTRIWWLPIAAMALVVVTAFLARDLRIPIDRHTPLGDVRDLSSLQEYAERKLRGLRYQLSHTTGWSGSLGLPLGLQGTASTTLGLSAQPMTYPEVVADFRAFLERTTTILRGERNVSPIPVVIILDELDKIASAERVQEFLNEAKALFALDQPGCLFLVSVSEDALAHFERRGLPVRDAFDSTFDTILRVDYLNIADAIRIVRSRVVRLSAPFICLSYCLSGGLPRELVRYTREVVNEPQRELTAVCASIVTSELRSKASALETIVARNVNAEPFASDLVNFINMHTVPSVTDLLDALAHPPIPADISDAAHDESIVQLRRLQAEVLSHIYYCVTLIEIFSNLTEIQFAEGLEKTGDGSFEVLASARRRFAVNARLAWMTISRFRGHWNLLILDPPVHGG